MAASRAELRSRIEPGYSFLRHAFAIHVVALSVAGAALAFLSDVKLVELWAVAGTFLFANAVEYVAHRGPMHRFVSGLGLLFARHTLAHHAFFRDDCMKAEHASEMRLVLFPAWAGALVLALAAPLGLIVGWFFSRNAGLLYVATAAGYYLAYEWLHASFHLAPEGLARLPLLGRAAARHRIHHDPARMNSVNFNITFPIVDSIVGTKANR